MARQKGRTTTAEKVWAAVLLGLLIPSVAFLGMIVWATVYVPD